MTTRVDFTSRKGTPVSGELAAPAGDGKVGGVVLIQEWWGVNDHIRSLVERVAKEGFVVVAPDLYHGKVTTDAAEAGTLMTALDTLVAVDEIAGAAQMLREHGRCNGKVAVMGFCLGGALSLASACHVEGLSAIVPFYGIPPAEKVDYARAKAPVLGHYAKHDEWASASKAEEVQKTITAAGGRMTLHVYDAQHAFMNDTRSDVYHAESAKLAWERTVAFLKEHLA